MPVPFETETCGAWNPAVVGRRRPDRIVGSGEACPERPPEVEAPRRPLTRGRRTTRTGYPSRRVRDRRRSRSGSTARRAAPCHHANAPQQREVIRRRLREPRAPRPARSRNVRRRKLAQQHQAIWTAGGLEHGDHRRRWRMLSSDDGGCAGGTTTRRPAAVREVPVPLHSASSGSLR